MGQLGLNPVCVDRIDRVRSQAIPQILQVQPEKQLVAK